MDELFEAAMRDSPPLIEVSQPVVTSSSVQSASKHVTSSSKTSLLMHKSPKNIISTSSGVSTSDTVASKSSLDTTLESQGKFPGIEFGKQYPLEISNELYFQLQFNFKPSSIDINKMGELELLPTSNEANIKLQTTNNGFENFQGTLATEYTERLLYFQDDRFHLATIEKDIRQIRHVRNEEVFGKQYDTTRLSGTVEGIFKQKQKEKAKAISNEEKKRKKVKFTADSEKQQGDVSMLDTAPIQTDNNPPIASL